VKEKIDFLLERVLSICSKWIWIWIWMCVSVIDIECFLFHI
jgi:hypothetical protein